MGHLHHPSHPVLISWTVDTAPRPEANHHTLEDHGTHNRHEGHSTEMFRNRVLVRLALTVPVLCDSEIL